MPAGRSVPIVRLLHAQLVKHRLLSGRSSGLAFGRTAKLPFNSRAPCVAWPNVFRRLPTTSQDKLAYRSIRPAAAGWLVDRTAQVKMTLGRRVVRADNGGSGVLLELDDGSKRDVQHVVLATGYRVDVAKEPVLASLRNGLATVDGYPLLRRGFESSVSGLRFVGAYAAVSFGPVMRFVSGTPFTAAAVAQHLAGR